MTDCCWAAYLEHEKELCWAVKKEELVVALRAEMKVGLMVLMKVGLMA